MVDEQDKPAGPNESKVVPINGAGQPSPEPQSAPEFTPEVQPYEPDDMPPPDWSTDQIQAALEEYAEQEQAPGSPGMDDHPPAGAPASAAELNQQALDMLESMSGGQDEEPDEPEDEPEQEQRIDHGGAPPTLQALPDLEIKAPQPAPEQTAPTGQDKPATQSEKVASDTPADGKQASAQAQAGKAEGEQKADADDEDPEQKKLREQRQMPMAPGYGGPQMMQSNVGSLVGYAIGSLFHGAVTGSFSLLKGALGIKPEDEDKARNSVEKLNVDAAAKPANDEDFNRNAAQWRQDRLKAEYEHLQLDMDAHLKAVDNMAETEWAKTLKSVENNPDPGVRAKAPAILKEAKQKLDFRRAEGDLSQSEHLIQQRAERIAGMANGDSEKLEAMFNQWQEETKKRLDKIPESEEKTGLINRIQGMVSNMMAGLQALFSKSSMSMK